MSSLYEHPLRISTEQQREWEDRAEAVRLALLRAGLPTTVVAEDHEVLGVNVFVDAEASKMGGVYARWRASETLISTASEALGAGRIDDPVVRHSGSVVLVMGDAVRNILVSAGFSAQMADDDVRIMTVQILAAPPE